MEDQEDQEQQHMQLEKMFSDRRLLKSNPRYRFL